MLFYSVTVKFLLWVALLQLQLSELGFISVLAQKPNRLPNARSFRYRPLQPPADSLVPPPSVASVTEARLPENISATRSDLLSEPCASCSLTMIDTVSAPEAPLAQTVTTTAEGDSQVRPPHDHAPRRRECEDSAPRSFRSKRHIQTEDLLSPPHVALLDRRPAPMVSGRQMISRKLSYLSTDP